MYAVIAIIFFATITVLLAFVLVRSLLKRNSEIYNMLERHNQRLIDQLVALTDKEAPGIAASATIAREESETALYLSNQKDSEKMPAVNQVPDGQEGKAYDEMIASGEITVEEQQKWRPEVG